MLALKIFVSDLITPSSEQDRIGCSNYVNQYNVPITSRTPKKFFFGKPDRTTKPHKSSKKTPKPGEQPQQNRNPNNNNYPKGSATPNQKQKHYPHNLGPKPTTSKTKSTEAYSPTTVQPLTKTTVLHDFSNRVVWPPLETSVNPDNATNTTATADSITQSGHSETETGKNECNIQQFFSQNFNLY